MSEASSSRASKAKNAPKILLAITVALLLFAAWRFGVFARFSDPARLRETLLRLGPRGLLVFFLAVSFLQPFGIPGMMWVIVASLIWPAPEAILLSLAACTMASINGFAFARYIGRDWVEKRIPPKLREYDARLETNGFATVFVLRMILSMNPTLHALFGVSRVRFSTHLIASILAYIPHIIVLTYVGAVAFTLLKDLSLARWIELAAAAATLLFLIWLFRRMHRKHRPA